MGLIIGEEVVSGWNLTTQTVSTNVFSTLLKRSTPETSSSAVKANETVSYDALTVALRGNVYLMLSPRMAIGLSPARHRQLSGICESGYMTGVAYIQIWMRKPLKRVKARYFAVSAESQRPTPRPSAAICSTTNGKQMIAL